MLCSSEIQCNSSSQQKQIINFWPQQMKNDKTWEKKKKKKICKQINQTWQPNTSFWLSANLHLFHTYLEATKLDIIFT